MESGRRTRHACVALAIAGLACSGERTVRSTDRGGDSTGGFAGDVGAGGSATGGSSGTSGGGAGTTGGGAAGMSGGGGELPYGLHVNATTIGRILDYADVTASFRDVANGRELAIDASITDDAGAMGYFRIRLGPEPVLGTHACSESVYVTTYQLCCLNVYDSRYPPTDPDCWVTLTEVGSALGTDVAGTFNAVTHDENGGRLFLREGRFRARL